MAGKKPGRSSVELPSAIESIGEILRLAGGRQPVIFLDLGLRIEADRMVNSLFDPEEVESERTVIISERQGAENQPMFLLSEEVTAAAFRVQP